MTTEQKKELIWKIIEVLKGQSILHNKPFDVGDVFISLAFSSDEKLKKIASLCKVKLTGGAA